VLLTIFLILVVCIFAFITVCILHRAIKEHILKISSHPLYDDDLQELQDLLLVSLNFHKERKILSQAFLCPRKGTFILMRNQKM